MPIIRAFSRSLVLLAAPLILLAGCAGYTMGPIKPARLASVSSIAVPTFKNMTLEPRSSVLITNEVIKRLQNDGSFKVASSASADAVLKGTLIEIRRRPLRSARFNTLRTREMEFEITVDFTLEDARTREVLADGRARGSSHIFLDENFQLTERQALNEAAAEAARDLVTRLSEGIPGQTGVATGRDILGNRRSSSSF
ncbi:MAG: LPS assembly lipoprotein LptE [Verrucomicrobiales bacterium]